VEVYVYSVISVFCLETHLHVLEINCLKLPLIRYDVSWYNCEKHENPHWDRTYQRCRSSYE